MSEKNKNESGECISTSTAIWLIVGIIVSATVAIALTWAVERERNRSGAPKTVVWEVQDERFWERGEFDTFQIQNFKSNSAFVSYSYTDIRGGAKKTFRCARAQENGPNMTCSYLDGNDQVISGPGQVWLTKVSDFLYEGYVKEVAWKGKKYEKVKQVIRRR